jgi:pyruvate dehydrogenase E1 component alpha subunit
MLTNKIASRAAAYGMEGITVDGNDAEAVYAATAAAAEKVRRTRKPMLLETYTYRTRGHYEPHDDQSYMDAQELAQWQQRDPIELLKRKLIEQRSLTGADVERMQQRVQETITDALTFANDSPFPNASELTTDVYA